MSRRHEPARSELPPPAPQQAELGQSKAFEDRKQSGPPGQDFFPMPDGTVKPSHRPGDANPANDAKW